MRVKNVCRIIIVFIFLTAVVLINKAQALIAINEVLADPATGLSGDSNHDGVSSSTNDEFVELLNFGANPVDISGWTLADAIQTRHVFPANTLLSSNQYLVVFGGGNPNLPGINWQKASTGTLSLNNTSETVKLSDNLSNLIDQVVYGTLANQDQSIVRNPEGAGAQFVLHASLPEANGALFSPGKSVSGQFFSSSENTAPNTSTVPEPSSLILSLIGGAALLKRGKNHIAF